MNAAMPLFDGTLPEGLNGLDAQVARIIHAHKGKAARITVAQILDRLGRPKTKTHEIEIRHTVAQLCEGFELPIIGVRTGGYFWAETPEECVEGALPLFNQGVKMIRRARRLMPGPRFRQELYRAKLEAL